MRKLLIIFILMISLSAAGQSRPEIFSSLAQTHDPVKEFNLWAKLADSYLYSGQPDSERISNNRLLQIATENHNDSLTGIAYGYISAYFSNAGDYAPSLEWLFKGLSITEKTGDDYGICFIAKQLGVVYKSLKNYPEALKYMRMAQEHLPKKDAREDLADRVYDHMAETFLGLGNTDSALRYVQMANEEVSRTKEAYSIARTLYIFAAVYSKKGDADLAESYYKKCIAFSDSTHISLPRETASLDYGTYLLANSQPGPAAFYALKGFHSAMISRDKAVIIQSASLLRKIYQQAGIRDSVLYYSDIKDAYRDSVFNEQNLIHIQNLGFSRQLQEQEDRAKATERKKERNHNLQIAGISIALISFIIIFLFLSHSIIASSKLIRFLGVLGLLIVFEFINLLLHPSLVKLTNDSAVLMLIILVSIAALLIPLHHKMETLITKKLVEKNNRIKLAAAKKTIERLNTQN